MNINITKLRKDLIDYFGSAMPFYQISVIDLIKIENCTEEELIKIAIDNGFNIYDYIEKNNHHR